MVTSTHTHARTHHLLPLTLDTRVQSTDTAAEGDNQTNSLPVQKPSEREEEGCLHVVTQADILRVDQQGGCDG